MSLLAELLLCGAAVVVAACAVSIRDAIYRQGVAAERQSDAAWVQAHATQAIRLVLEQLAREHREERMDEDDGEGWKRGRP